MNKHLFGGLLITLSMVVFSMVGPFVRYLKLPPPLIIFYSSLFSVLLILLWFGVTGRLRSLIIREKYGWLLLSALLILGNTYTYYVAYTLTTMANAVLTHYTAPIFAAFFAPALLGEKLKRITVIALIISMTGLVLIASNDIAISSQHLSGIGYGVLSGLFYGLSILASKKLVHSFSPYVILFCQCAITTVVVAPVLGRYSFSITAQTLIPLLLYTLMICLFGLFLYLKGLRHVEAQHAGILAYSEPVIVVLIGYLFYSEVPTMPVLAGGVLIVYSGYLILRAQSRRA